MPEILSVDPESVRPGATFTVDGKRVGPETVVTVTREGTEDHSACPSTYKERDGTLEVRLPDDLPTGPYLLTVSTNDVTSAPVEIEVTKA